MGIEKLERGGFLLPERLQGNLSLRSPVNRPLFLLVGVLGYASCAVMYLGRGRVWTWFGVVGFLLALFAFLWIGLRAVRIQHERLERLLHRASRPPKAADIVVEDR